MPPFEKLEYDNLNMLPKVKIKHVCLQNPCRVSDTSTADKCVLQGMESLGSNLQSHHHHHVIKYDTTTNWTKDPLWHVVLKGSSLKCLLTVLCTLEAAGQVLLSREASSCTSFLQYILRSALQARKQHALGPQYPQNPKLRVELTAA